MFFEGKHVEQNQAQALRWFTRAAQGGNAFAQAWLGDILVQGRACPRTGMRPRGWYERAAAAGARGRDRGADCSLRAAGSRRRMSSRKCLSYGCRLRSRAMRVRSTRSEISICAAWAPSVGGRSAPLAHGRCTSRSRARDGVARRAPVAAFIRGSDQAEAVDLFRRAAAQGNPMRNTTSAFVCGAASASRTDDVEAEQLYSAAAAAGPSIRAIGARRPQSRARALMRTGAKLRAGIGSRPMRAIRRPWRPLQSCMRGGRGVENDPAAALTLYRQALRQGTPMPCRPCGALKLS
jgi:TPR repeat protein